MLLGITCSGRWRYLATIISRLVVGISNLFKEVLDARLHESPGALVLGLVLHPLHLGVAIARERRLELAEREGAQLFNAHDSDVFDATLCPLIVQIVV